MINAARAGVLQMRLRPSAKAKRLFARRHGQLRIRLWVSYIPLYAFQTDVGFYGLRAASGGSGHPRGVPIAYFPNP
jgi:hypothetical protein